MDRVELTNGEAWALYRTIHALGDVKASIRFTYALGRTRRALQPIIETLEAAQQAQHARYLEAAAEHAEQDEAGNPVKVEEDQRTGYRIDPARQADFAAVAQALADELNALLAETVTAEVHRVQLDVVPDLTSAQVEALWPMLADPAAP